MHINKSSGGGAGVGVLLFDLLLDMHLQQTMEDQVLTVYPVALVLCQ